MGLRRGRHRRRRWLSLGRPGPPRGYAGRHRRPTAAEIERAELRTTLLAHLRVERLRQDARIAALEAEVARLRDEVSELAGRLRGYVPVLDRVESAAPEATPAASAQEPPVTLTLPLVPLVPLAAASSLEDGPSDGDPQDEPVVDLRPADADAVA